MDAVERTNVGARRILRDSSLALALLGALGMITVAGSADAAGNVWHVSASAAPGGNGSQALPFNTLNAVQQASTPGDMIIVDPSPVSVPPLDGGIALKAGQRLIGGGPSVIQMGASLIPNGPPLATAAPLTSLPRITNSTNAANSGDAVRLADSTDVENLVIVSPFRGGIYGKDVLATTVRGNDISGFNTSGATGFVVQPFFASSYIAGMGGPENTGIGAGWAAILFDATTVETAVTISNNYVHDGACGDGIDIRGMGNSYILAQVNQNFVTRLVQCSMVRTIEGIGTQVTGTAQMLAILNGNTEANNGNAGANMDSLFVDPAESGSLVEKIVNNVYITGVGGASTNGFEYIVSNGGGTSSVAIINSYFQNNPGDMLQELNFGDGATALLVLDNVSVQQTTIARGLPPYALPPGTLTGATNTGDCLDIVANGANDTTIFQMVNSSFTGCDNNGIEVTTNLATGNGVGPLHTVSLDIENSRIAGSRYYNIWFNNITPLTLLTTKVQNTDLSTSTNGVAVAFDQQLTASTGTYAIDFGGGALGSQGGNCILGGAIYDLEATGYNISAQQNWWGSSTGPGVGRISVSSGATLDASRPLTSVANACK